jgi:[ribosomal protein S5]-alanine N-acetyltransferase
VRPGDPLRRTETSRLELVPATVDLVEAELRDPAELGQRLGAVVPAGWPPEPYDRPAAEYTIARLAQGPEQAGWWLHYMVLVDPPPRTVIGTCGYKGPPGADGTVEIGYGVLPAFHRRGYAFEAVQALIERAFAQPEVGRVIAETFPHLTPSKGLLQKAGFHLVSEGSEPGVICYELRRGDAR